LNLVLQGTGEERARGEEEGGDALFQGLSGRISPRGEKAQESRESLTRTNPLGSQRRERLFWGELKPLKHRKKAERFFSQVQEWRGGFERIHRPLGRSKALKREAQERWELKEASEVRETKERRLRG